MGDRCTRPALGGVHIGLGRQPHELRSWLPLGNRVSEIFPPFHRPWVRVRFSGPASVPALQDSSTMIDAAEVSLPCTKMREEVAGYCMWVGV